MTKFCYFLFIIKTFHSFINFTILIISTLLAFYIVRYQDSSAVLRGHGQAPDLHGVCTAQSDREGPHQRSLTAPQCGHQIDSPGQPSTGSRSSASSNTPCGDHTW